MIVLESLIVVTIMNSVLEILKYGGTIVDLVNNNPGQLSVNEYSFIVNKLIGENGCNFLVFGVGRDSKLWLDVNSNGKTVFLENCESWINKVTDMIDCDIDIRNVEYTSKSTEWESIIDDVDKLTIELPQDIIDTEWDYIFVDSPQGWIDDKTPGRMQSIFMSSSLKCNKGIFLHDVERVIETVYGEKYFGKPTERIDRLNYWRVNND
jgi:hypothetical protein